MLHARRQTQKSKTKMQRGTENEVGENLSKRAKQADRQRDRIGALSFIFTACRMNRASVLLLCSNTPHGCLLPATTMHTHTHIYTRLPDSEHNNPIEKHR